MSELVEALREVRVFNDHEFFNGDTPAGQVFLSYTSDLGRGGRGRYWHVHRVGYKTDPKGHWHHYGSKAFDAYGTRDGMSARATALEDAKAWATAKYGITAWARTPFGSHGDAAFVKARTAELKAALAVLRVDAPRVWIGPAIPWKPPGD